MIYRDCYCAFCRQPRRVYSRRHVGVAEFLGSILAGGLISFFFFEELDPRAAVFSICFLILSEGVISLRWRLSLACPNCGFDALLYLRSPSKAAQSVLHRREAFLKDPLHIMKPHRYGLVPTRKPTAESLLQRQTSPPGANLLREPGPTDSLNS